MTNLEPVLPGDLVEMLPDFWSIPAKYTGSDVEEFRDGAFAPGTRHYLADFGVLDQVNLFFNPMEKDCGSSICPIAWFRVVERNGKPYPPESQDAPSQLHIDATAALDRMSRHLSALVLAPIATMDAMRVKLKDAIASARATMATMPTDVSLSADEGHACFSALEDLVSAVACALGDAEMEQAEIVRKIEGMR